MTRHPASARMHFEEPSYEAAVPFVEEAFAASKSEVISRGDVIQIAAKYPDLFAPLIASMSRSSYSLGRDAHTHKTTQALALLAVEWAAWGNLRRHGQKTFVFSGPLTRLLEHTDFNVPRSVVRLPFPCVYYRWLDSELTINNPDGTSHQVEGAYVFHETGPGVDGAPHRALTAYIVTRDAKTKTPNALYFSANWDDLEAAVATDDMRRVGVPEINIPLANLIINSTLYLASPNAETRREISPHREIDKAKTRNPKKLRHLAKERENTTGVDYIYVGASVSTPTDGTGAPLTMHHWVRGHWRMQPYGPKLAERRALWIKPYERGADLGEQVARRYVVR